MCSVLDVKVNGILTQDNELPDVADCMPQHAFVGDFVQDHKVDLYGHFSAPFVMYEMKEWTLA